MKSKGGFELLDALHLAAAESCVCEFFITTEDRNLKNARDTAAIEHKFPKLAPVRFFLMILSAALNQKAKAILLRKLGPLDFARFSQHYETGVGNTRRTAMVGAALSPPAKCISKPRNSRPTAFFPDHPAQPQLKVGSARVAGVR